MTQDLYLSYLLRFNQNRISKKPRLVPPILFDHAHFAEAGKTILHATKESERLERRTLICKWGCYHRNPEWTDGVKRCIWMSSIQTKIRLSRWKERKDETGWKDNRSLLCSLYVLWFMNCWVGQQWAFKQQ